MGNSVETESKLGLEEGTRSDCLIDTGSPLGVMKMFWN